MMKKCVKFLSGRNITTAKCRLLYLSDATGSMSAVWRQTQDSIRTMLERIAAISGGSGNIEVVSASQLACVCSGRRDCGGRKRVIMIV